MDRIAGRWGREAKTEMTHIDYYTEAWQAMDAITTVVEANGYGIYDLRQTDFGFRLELNSHIDDEAAEDLCGQFSLSADYGGEGEYGTLISLYKD